MFICVYYTFIWLISFTLFGILYVRIKSIGGNMDKIERIARQTEVARVIKEAVVEKGYSDIASFTRGSGLAKHISFETVRRTVNEPSRPVAASTVACVMRFLDFPESEIIKTVDDLGDSVLSILMKKSGSQGGTGEGQGVSLSIEQQGLIDAVNKINNIYPSIYAGVAGFLRSIAGCISIDIEKECNRMARQKRTRTHTPKVELKNRPFVGQGQNQEAAQEEQKESVRVLQMP
jgi:hypothetical protein